MSPSPSAAATVRRPTADGGPRTPKAKGIAPFRPLFKGLFGPYLRAFKGRTSGNERQGAHYGTGIAISRRRQRGIKEASRRGQGGVKEAVLCAAAVANQKVLGVNDKPVIHARTVDERRTQ